MLVGGGRQRGSGPGAGGPGARRRWSSTGKRTWCGRTWCSSAVVVNGEADLVRATPSPRRHSSWARKHLGDGGCVPAVAARAGEMWGGEDEWPGVRREWG